MDQQRFKAIKIIMQRAQVNNCPVAAVKTTIYKDTVTNRKVFVNEFVNNCQHTVSAITVKISCFGEGSKLLGTIKDYKYSDLNVAQAGEFGQNKLIACPTDDISSFAVTITDVELEDNYYWNEKIKKISSHEEVIVEMAPEVPDEDDDTTDDNVPETTDAPVVENLPETIEDIGLSSINISNDEGTSITASFSSEVSTPADNEAIKSSDTVVETKQTEETVKEEPVKEEDAKEEPVKEEHAKEEAAELKKETQPVQSQTVEIDQYSSDENSTGKRKKVKKPMPKPVKMTMIIIVIAILAAVAIISIKKYKQISDYNRGTAFFTNGQYENAVTVFSRLGNYKNSQAMLTEAKGKYADSLKSEGRYEEAINVYKELSGKDNEITECYNEWIAVLIEAGDLEKAEKLLDNSDVSFDEEYTVIINYNKALKLYEAKDYRGTIDLLKDSKKYQDSDKIVSDSYYQLGVISDGNADYKTALDMFLNAGQYKDAQKLVEKEKYQLARAEFENQSYEQAIKMFEEIPEYEDSKEWIKHSCYMLASKYFNSLNYEEAKEYFQKAEDYQDAEERYQESLYQYALTAMQNEVTQEILDSLNELPKNYKDVSNITKTLKKYIAYVGEYKWYSSNDKEVNDQGGFEDHIFVKLVYDNGSAILSVDGNTIDLRNLSYKSGTNSNSYDLRNNSTLTRTLNGKVHTYKKIIKD